MPRRLRRKSDQKNQSHVLRLGMKTAPRELAETPLTAKDEVDAADVHRRSNPPRRWASLAPPPRVTFVWSAFAPDVAHASTPSAQCLETREARIFVHPNRVALHTAPSVAPGAPAFFLCTLHARFVARSSVLLFRRGTRMGGSGVFCPALWT